MQDDAQRKGPNVGLVSMLAELYFEVLGALRGRGEEAAWLGLVAEQALDRHLVCLGYQDAKERAKDTSLLPAPLCYGAAGA